jgi:hypothetical protein
MQRTVGTPISPAWAKRPYLEPGPDVINMVGGAYEYENIDDLNMGSHHAETVYLLNHARHYSPKKSNNITDQGRHVG